MLELYSVPLIYLIVLAALGFWAGALCEYWAIKKMQEAKHKTTEKRWAETVKQWQKEINLRTQHTYAVGVDPANDLKPNEKGHFSVMMMPDDTTLEHHATTVHDNWFYNTNKLMARPLAIEPDYDSKGNLVGMSIVSKDEHQFPKDNMSATDQERWLYGDDDEWKNKTTPR